MEAGNASPEVRKQTARLELLAGVATDLLRFQQAGDLLRSVFDRLSRENGIDLCFCYQVEGRDRLRLLFCAGVAPHVEKQIERLTFGEGVCGKAAQERCFLHPESIQTSDDPAVQVLREAGIDAFCCYPLLVDGRLIGTLSFGAKRSPSFDRNEVDLQHAIADQVAVALDRILLIKTLEESNRELARLNTDLQRANMDIEQFAFSASHDLREPLRNLAIYSQLLRRTLDAGDSAATQDHLQIVVQSAGRMESLLRDLLTFIEVRHDRSDHSNETDADVAVERALASLQTAVRATSAAIHIEHPLPVLRIGERHLIQLFRNLIDNALKYHTAGIKPQIHISVRRGASDPIICVQDNGLGIAPKHQKTVFGLFKRLHAAEEYEGTGLGLAVCEKIVEQYNGHIWVESELGKGAVFCFQVPAAPESRKSLSATSSA